MSQTYSTRRAWLRQVAGVSLGASVSPWLGPLAARAGADPARRRSCILLWMPGGPSQLDTFDPKPGHANGGPFAAIDTAVPGIQICEHLPRLAQAAQHLAIVRSMTTKEGDHLRASQLVRTGYTPGGVIDYPMLGSLIAHQAQATEMETELPRCVSVGSAPFGLRSGFTAGYLGPRFAPLTVGTNYLPASQIDWVTLDNSLRVSNLRSPGNVAADRLAGRRELLAHLEDDYRARRRGEKLAERHAAYRQAEQMMQGLTQQVFDVSSEPEALRELYGRNLFGQGCLLARRLVARGVPFVEVNCQGSGERNVFGWDTHQDNFNTLRGHCRVLDDGFATLLSDLKSRGLLEETLVVWMGEFGRTPVINSNAGRDHFPQAWSAVLAGSGIVGGQTIGRTSRDGMEVQERPTSIGDLLATVFVSLGLDPKQQTMSNVGRPIRLADPEAKPLMECLA